MRENTSVSGGQILDKEADLLRTYVADNTALVGSALTRDRGFLNRLSPGPEDRLVRDHGLEQMKAGFDYRRQALRMAIDTKLQAIEEMCNHVLVTGKSEIRRQRQEFFAEQRLKLERELGLSFGEVRSNDALMKKGLKLPALAPVTPNSLNPR